MKPLVGFFVSLVMALGAVGLFIFEISRFVDSVSQVMISLFGCLAIVFLVLHFAKAGYVTWKKFAVIYIPISLILIAVTPENAGFMNPDRELMTWFLSGLFLLISLAVIGIKSWKARREGGKYASVQNRR